MALLSLQPVKFTVYTFCYWCNSSYDDNDDDAREMYIFGDNLAFNEHQINVEILAVSFSAEKFQTLFFRFYSSQMLTFLRDELDGKARTHQTTDRHFLNKLSVFSRQLEDISFRLHNFSTAARRLTRVWTHSRESVDETLSLQRERKIIAMNLIFFNTHKFPLQAYAVNKNKLLWLQPQILAFFIWNLIHCHDSLFSLLRKRSEILPRRHCRHEQAHFRF